MTPSRAIRLHCLDCCQTRAEVLLCGGTACALYPYRTGKKTQPGLPRLRAIRVTCLGCVCGSTKEVRTCTAGPSGAGYRCPLWQYRSGKTGRVLSDAQRAVYAERLAKNLDRKGVSAPRIDEVE